MRRLHLDTSWPASWQYSYAYDLQEIYGEVARRGYAYSYQARRDAALALICEAVPAGGRILDVAAAQGNFTLALAERGYDVTWNDLRADLAGYVEQKRERGTVRYAPGNVLDFDEAAAFDAVLATEVIEHVAHPDAFLKKLGALVRPGGVVVLTTPNGAYLRHHHPRFSECADPSVYESVQFQPDADGHVFLLHPDEIGTLAAAAGLELDAMRLFSNVLTSGHMGTEAVLQRLPRGVVRACEAVTSRLPAWPRERLSSHLAIRLRKPA
jgi:2-polyprenyl-3-methyl-5-hydroxy-6-metoxy-1,4-benzoquinol methylase